MLEKVLGILFEVEDRLLFLPPVFWYSSCLFEAMDVHNTAHPSAPYFASCLDHLARYPTHTSDLHGAFLLFSLELLTLVPWGAVSMIVPTSSNEISSSFASFSFHFSLSLLACQLQLLSLLLLQTVHFLHHYFNIIAILSDPSLPHSISSSHQGIKITHYMQPDYHF